MVCHCCKKTIPEDLTTRWDGEEGSVDVPMSSTISVLITTDVGEFEVCEACFKSGDAFNIFPDHVAQIREQFDLEYKMRKALGLD